MVRKPGDTGDIILNCRLTGLQRRDAAVWEHRNRGVSRGILSTNLTVMSMWTSKYEIQSGRPYHLKIKSPALADGGTYTCSNLLCQSVGLSAEVTIIGKCRLLCQSVGLSAEVTIIGKCRLRCVVCWRRQRSCPRVYMLPLFQLQCMLKATNLLSTHA